MLFHHANMPILYFLLSYFLNSYADYGVDKYDIGTGFGHFAIASEDV